MSRLISVRTLIVLLTVATFVTAAAQAQTTWYVDDDAPNDPGPGDPTVSDPNENGTSEHPFDAIQEGIDAAVDGDTVLVLDGTYTGTGNKNLDFHGKAITVRSENGPDTCIIDCENDGRGFYFNSGETADAVVDGFTITNGRVTGSESYGAGVYCHDTSPTITNCILTANTADRGGAVYCENGSPPIANCLFAGNMADKGAAGHFSQAAFTLVNCTIAGNHADTEGGGLNIVTASTATITNCILSGNQAPQGSAVNLMGMAHPSTLTISYSDVHGGQGTIYVRQNCTLIWEDTCIVYDPLFAEPEAGDYHLQSGSACIDAATNDPPGGLPPYDLDGVPRPLDGDGDFEPWSGQSETADMGVYEFDPGAPRICLSAVAFDFVAPEGGPNPEGQALCIWNCSVGTLNWQVLEQCSWLDVDPTSGESGGEIDEVTLTVDVVGLVPGEHSCVLDVVDPRAANSPRTVDVRLRVSAVLHVPADYSTIQAAIGAAQDGETVMVADGTYTGAGNTDLDFGGKAITVRSELGPDNCVIDCQSAGRGFRFQSHETHESIIDGFTIVNSSLPGAIYCADFTGPIIRRCTVTGNGQDGVHCADASILIQGCAITNNTGQGIHSDGDLTVTDCIVTGNTGDGIFTVSGIAITNCFVADNGGTGIYCHSGPTRIANCDVFNNGGRGITVNTYGTTTIAHCVVVGHTTDYRAGGISCENGSRILVDCIVAGNEGENGGGLYLEDTAAILVNCVLASNESQEQGGGVFGTESELTFVNCTITDNEAAWDGGGAHFDDSSITMSGCTVARNATTYEGGGLHVVYESEAIVRNSILWDNDAILGPEIYLDSPGLPATVVTVSYSDVDGGEGAIHIGHPAILNWGDGNIDEDPLFIDADGPDDDPNTFEDNDYRLSAGSPCIDAADNEAVPADEFDLDGDGDIDEPIPFDLDGNPRFVDDPATDDTGNGTPPIVDMGAYEFQVGIVAYLDIKPGSCPNPLNRNSHGVLPAAIVGTADFDVTQIDVETLVLMRADGVGGSVTPLMGPPGPGIHVEDVATPFEGEPCECHELGGDGIDDLSMKFDTEAVVAELELNDLPGGALLELVVSGELFQGTPFSATDCIRLVPAGPGGGSSASAVENDGRDVLPAGRQTMPPEGLSAGDSSRADADAGELARPPASEVEETDADQDEGSQAEVGAPLAACGPLSPAFLLATIVGIRLVRRPRLPFRPKT